MLALLEAEFEQAVDQMLARIAATPLRFRPVQGEVRRGLLRRFPYAMHFLPEPNAIVVLAVFHTKRDPRRLEGRSRSFEPTAQNAIPPLRFGECRTTTSGAM